MKPDPAEVEHLIRPGNLVSSQLPDSELVFARLSHEISIGEIAYGTRLVEAQLADRYGVSRTPVRQALLALEQDGLLVRSGRSLQVRTPTPTEITELYEVREILEERAARLAATRHDDSDVFVLEHLIQRMTEEANVSERYTLNREFHTSIWRAAHHGMLFRTLERLYSNSVVTLPTTLTNDDHWQRTRAEHTAMLNAILARDEDGVADLVRSHLRTARDIRLNASINRTWQT